MLTFKFKFNLFGQNFTDDLWKMEQTNPCHGPHSTTSSLFSVVMVTPGAAGCTEWACSRPLPKPSRIHVWRTWCARAVKIFHTGDVNCICTNEPSRTCAWCQTKFAPARTFNRKIQYWFAQYPQQYWMMLSRKAVSQSPTSYDLPN